MTDIHDHIEDWMATALADGLSSTEKEAFAQHLASCSVCHQLYQETKMTSSFIQKTLSIDRPSEGFEERMVSRFRRQLVNRKTSAFSSILRLLRAPYFQLAAATAAVMVLIQVGGHLTGERGSLARARQESGRLPQYRQCAVGSGASIETWVVRYPRSPSTSGWDGYRIPATIALGSS